MKNSKGAEIYKSACRMCHGGCGVLVHVEKGKVTKIKGDPDSPLNKGKMCIKGLSSIEHLYHPNRLKYPLKRKGRRGEGKWTRITWDEALSIVTERIEEVRDRYGVESVALGQGTGRHHRFHAIRFANALGTPNWCEPGTAQCFVPRVSTGKMTYGDMPVCDYYGDVNPACLLVWGHNPVISGPDGELQFSVKDCMKKGTKLIVIDPRETEMAQKADLWLQIRPGTDDALALSMMHVMIEENIYDEAFVKEWTIGFDALADRVQDYSPEWAEKVTWIPADRIREAARMFATTKPATLEWGVALEHTPNCLQTVRAVALLPGITGNIDIPGGWIMGMHLIEGGPGLQENLTEEARSRRLGGDTYRILGGKDAGNPSAHIPTLMNAMRTGKPYPIKAFLIFGNNGLVSYGNSKKIYKSLMSLDFLSVMDIYMTPTAELADIVLPAATWLEVDQIVSVPHVATNVVMAQQKITSMWESRPDEDVFRELAQRLKLEVGAEPLEDLFNSQLEPLNITFKELKERGFVTVPITYRKYEKKGFDTPSGKIELYSSVMERNGYDPLPYYQEPPESPLSAPELAKEYPLILITGGRSQYFFHSEFRQIEPLRKRDPDPIVEINPELAAEKQIKEGDWVWIETIRGRIKQKAGLTKGIDPRVVNVQHGWWFPEDPGPEYGVWKSNANVLTNIDPPYDPAMGTYQLRALLCRISKVEKGGG